MEEYLKIIKDFLKECENDLDGEICLKCNGLTTVAIKHLVKELERYKRIKPVDLDGEYILNIEEFLNVSNKLYELERNSIPKQVIRDEIEKLEKDAEKIREKKKDASDSDRSKSRLQAYLTKTNEIVKRLKKITGK